MKRKSLLFWVVALLIIGSLGTTLYYNLYIKQPYVQSRYIMDTYVTIRIHGRNPYQLKQAAEAVFTAMEQLEQISNRFGGEESEVVRINQGAGQDQVQVSEPIWNIIKTSLDYREATDDTFDITIGPLVDLWGIVGTEYQPRVPHDEEIQTTLPLVDMDQIQINVENRTVALTQEGMVMDLGGVAKGYAIDLALDVLKEHGIEQAMIDMVSSTGTLGRRPDGRPWRVGLQPPRALDGEAYLGILLLEDQFISTSGDYQRFFEEDGTRYHHIIDPGTGYPAPGMTSVTIVSSTTSLEADIISTAVFILGPTKGMELIESLPGIEGLLVDDRLNVHTSSGLIIEGLQRYR